MGEDNPQQDTPQLTDVPVVGSDANVSWTNRRFMAYIALFALVGLSLATFVIGILSLTVLEALVPIISVFTMAFTSIVGAYMGLATYSDKWLLTTRK